MTATRRSPRRRAPGPAIVRDPASVRGPRVRPVFDSRPHRNRGQNGIAHELPPPYSDAILIATLVAHGQPRWAAEQIRYHPPARYAALAFRLNVEDAAEGDKLAKERVDYCRWAWQQMRKDELIADTPHRTVGLPE